MVGVEQWAEIRRLHRVDGVSIREISDGRGCIARRSAGRWRRGSRRSTPGRRGGSKLDPFRDWICEQLAADPRIQSQRLREMASELGYRGGKSIFDDFVREVRPRFLAPRTFQRTIYRPGELVQCDLWEPSEHIPVGHGQRRRGWVVTCEVCWSRAIAGTLIFSKEAPDILFGLARNLQRLGALPEKLVWDREAAIAAGGRPTEPFAAFCGQLAVGWVILEPRDPQAKGRSSDHTGSCARTSSLAACSRTTSISRTASTPGPRRRTTGPPNDPGGPGRAARGGAERGCGRCPPGCRTSTAARSSGSRRSRSFGLIATTIRSTRSSLAVASRSASPRPRSPRSFSTPVSSPPGTGGCSPAV